jgi:hypothetical protein
MYDNKYIYFKNILYSYNILSYEVLKPYEIQILFLTIIDLLSYEYRIKLKNILDRYFREYKIKGDNIINYKRVPKLKDICILKIQRDNINYDKLSHYMKLRVKIPLYSIHDKGEEIINYFYYLLNKDKKKFMDFIVNKYIQVKDDLPSICDYTKTTLPTELNTNDSTRLSTRLPTGLPTS